MSECLYLVQFIIPSYIFFNFYDYFTLNNSTVQYALVQGIVKRSLFSSKNTNVTGITPYKLYFELLITLANVSLYIKCLICIGSAIKKRLCILQVIVGKLSKWSFQT